MTSQIEAVRTFAAWVEERTLAGEDASIEAYEDFLAFQIKTEALERIFEIVEPLAKADPTGTYGAILAIARPALENPLAE